MKESWVRPVYLDGDGFRSVPWPEAFRLQASLMERDEAGDCRPREFAIFLQLAALRWSGQWANAN
jgi:hypothetical protein